MKRLLFILFGTATAAFPHRWAGAGPEAFPQPISQIASLTTDNLWKVVFGAGGSIRLRMFPHRQFRAESRDYLTTFPRREIVPAPRNTARGVFEQFTPLLEAAYMFWDAERQYSEPVTSTGEWC